MPVIVTGHTPENEDVCEIIPDGRNIATYILGIDRAHQEIGVFCNSGSEGLSFLVTGFAWLHVNGIPVDDMNRRQKAETTQGYIIVTNPTARENHIKAQYYSDPS